MQVLVENVKEPDSSRSAGIPSEPWLPMGGSAREDIWEGKVYG